MDDINAILKYGGTCLNDMEGSYVRPHEKGYVIHIGKASTPYSRNQTVPNTTKLEIPNKEEKIFVGPNGADRRQTRNQTY